MLRVVIPFVYNAGARAVLTLFGIYIFVFLFIRSIRLRDALSVICARACVCALMPVQIKIIQFSTSIHNYDVILLFQCYFFVYFSLFFLTFFASSLFCECEIHILVVVVCVDKRMKTFR